MFPDTIVLIKKEQFTFPLFIVNLYGFNGWRKWFWTIFLGFKVLIVCGQLRFTVHSFGDLAQLTGVAATLPIPLMGLVKILCVHGCMETIQEMHSSIRKDFWDISMAASANMTRSLRLRVTIVNYLMRCHFMGAISMVFNFIMFPIAEHPEGVRPLPTLCWFPFNTNPSPLHEILFATLTFNNCMSVVSNAIFDFLFVYMAQHLVIQFIMLSGALRNLTKFKNDSIDIVEQFHDTSRQTALLRRMTVCVDHHANLIKFGRNLVNITALALGFQLLMSVLALVFSSFIILTGNDLIKSAKLFIYISSLSVQFLLFAAISTELDNQSESVSDAAYENEWYTGGPELRRGLRLIQLNAQQKIRIQAAWLVYVRNQTIIEIYRTVFSMLTFILEFDENYSN